MWGSEAMEGGCHLTRERFTISQADEEDDGVNNSWHLLNTVTVLRAVHASPLMPHHPYEVHCCPTSQMRKEKQRVVKLLAVHAQKGLPYLWHYEWKISLCFVRLDGFTVLEE